MNAINVGVGWALPLTAKHNIIDIIDISIGTSTIEITSESETFICFC